MIIPYEKKTIYCFLLLFTITASIPLYAISAQSDTIWVKHPSKYTKLINCKPGEVIHIKAISNSGKDIQVSLNQIIAPHGSNCAHSNGKGTNHNFTYQVPNKKTKKSSIYQYQPQIIGPTNGGDAYYCIW